MAFGASVDAEYMHCGLRHETDLYFNKNKTPTWMRARFRISRHVQTPPNGRHPITCAGLWQEGDLPNNLGIATAIGIQIEPRYRKQPASARQASVHLCCYCFACCGPSPATPLPPKCRVWFGPAYVGVLGAEFP